MQVHAGGIEAAPHVVKAYAARHGLATDAFRPDGRVSLTFDERFRVQLRPAPHGSAAIVAMLADLTLLEPARQDELLASLARMAAGVVREQGCGLALDDSGDLLMLQQQVPASSDLPQLEAALAQFVDALAFWTASLARASGRSAS